jgi:hypothetical protein
MRAVGVGGWGSELRVPSCEWQEKNQGQDEKLTGECARLYNEFGILYYLAKK